MQNHPSPLVRGNLIPLLGLLAWFSGGGLARAITDLLVSNPSTSSILRFDGFDGFTGIIHNINDTWERVLVRKTDRLGWQLESALPATRLVSTTYTIQIS